MQLKKQQYAEGSRFRYHDRIGRRCTADAEMKQEDEFQNTEGRTEETTEGSQMKIHGQLQVDEEWKCADSVDQRKTVWVAGAGRSKDLFSDCHQRTAKTEICRFGKE